VGWALIAFGVWISLRAALEAGDINIDSPTQLLTTGPYAHSRNPMYLGWTSLHLGIALAANSFWIIATLPLVVIVTHLFDIRREERRSLAEFGDEYRAYQEKVRRYF
jgi:protein-S-isoprenylcysteine O-methyltransferase Ste14